MEKKTHSQNDLREQTFTVPVTAVLGEGKILFMPLAHKGVENTIGFLDRGGKTDPVEFRELDEEIKRGDTKPILALQFKTKKSINTLIRFLRFYRDNVYKEDLCDKGDKDE